MARYNTVSLYLTVSGATVMTYAINGSIMTLTGATGYQVTLVTPAYATGWNQSFYNSTGGNVTLATPSGTFSGNGFTTGATITIPNNASFTVVSDGANYIVTNNEGANITRTGGTFSGLLTANGGILGNGGNIQFNPSNANILLTPSGSGAITITSAGAGTMDNVSVGATTRASGAFTTLGANSTATFTGQIVANTGANTQSHTTTGSAAITISSGGTGDIDNMRIGATTRAGGQFTTLAANAQTNFTANISSGSTGAGTVVVTGGIGISENIRAGGLLNVASSGTFGAGITATTGGFSSSVTDTGNRVLTSVSVSAGTGMSGGGTITGPSGSVTITNAGVLSLTGTTNRITVSASTGAITLNLPQDIQSGASPTFTATNFTGTAAGMSIGGTAAQANKVNNDTAYMAFHWSGNPGQPTWLWGATASADSYVYNPSNFNVNCAVCANTTVACCVQGTTLAANVTASSLTSHGTLGYLQVSGQSALCCSCVACACFQCLCVVQSAAFYGAVYVAPGQALYEGTQAGAAGGTASYTWTAPPGVSAVNVAVIGGGGGGYFGWAVCGGAGGGLSYANNVGVSPGSGYTVQVGNGGCWSQAAGGYSCFPGVIGGGGHCGCCSGCGCIAGGSGTCGGGPGTVTFPNTAGGGGGGGGYGPNQCWYSNSGHTGCYGGGGSAGSHHSSTYGTGGGGGTGITGQGTNGTCGNNRAPATFQTGSGGGGGSNGEQGVPGEPWSNGQGHGYNCGGNYGAGGGGSGTSHGGGFGGKGAVRIVWPTTGRCYPSGQS